MDNIGGHVNPLHLVRQLPAGMEIPGLRDRLVRLFFHASWVCRQACCRLFVQMTPFASRDRDKLHATSCHMDQICPRHSFC